MTRRDFFKITSKDMLKDMFSSWHTFKSEMQKEATKLSCDEAGLKLSRKAKRLHGKAASFMNRKAANVIPNSKGGKK